MIRIYFPSTQSLVIWCCPTSIFPVQSHLSTLDAIAPTDFQPPRKGCDPPFLTQLLKFQPLTIVYVSCNVHTQARDVGWFIDHSSQTKEEKKGEYILESLRGFDLFPQVRPFFLTLSFFTSFVLSFSDQGYVSLPTYLKTELTNRRLMLRVLPFFGGFLLASYSASDHMYISYFSFIY